MYRMYQSLRAALRRSPRSITLGIALAVSLPSLAMASPNPPPIWQQQICNSRRLVERLIYPPLRPGTEMDRFDDPFPVYLTIPDYGDRSLVSPSAPSKGYPTTRIVIDQSLEGDLIIYVSRDGQRLAGGYRQPRSESFYQPICRYPWHPGQGYGTPWRYRPGSGWDWLQRQ